MKNIQTIVLSVFVRVLMVPRRGSVAKEKKGGSR